MQATADSNTDRVREIGVAKMFCSNPKFDRAFPSKVMSRWPAIKLAVRRTHRVIGRMMFLVSSIITMNDIRTAGVP
jgi:hypothetical protein